jgi:fimbrial chaperone protein
MTRRLLRSLLPPLWLALLAAAPAEAGSLAVSPIRIELPPDGSPEVVHVRNGAVDSALVQVEAVAWGEDIDTAPRADEIIAVPPVFELKGEAEQILRLALRKPLAGASEKAYRLLITEVPREVSTPNALTFAVRLNFPSSSRLRAPCPTPSGASAGRRTARPSSCSTTGAARICASTGSSCAPTARPPPSSPAKR